MSTEFKGTTICAVRKNGKTAIAGDGQVTMGESVVFKNSAKKVRRIYNGKVVIGFAGITITSFPQRHQHLLIAHRIIVGVHTGDLRLAVPMPTDITLCPAALVTVNVAFRNLKSLDTIYRIALRLVTRQVLRMIGVGIADGIVRQHLLNEITAGGFAGTHLDIIIVAPHHTGNRIPLSIGLCLAIPATAGIGAATTPAVLGHSIGIVGPKGHIHAHQLPFSKGAL